MYADNMTDSMKEAIEETNRRRSIQNAYNEEYGIIPQTIVKEIRAPLSNMESKDDKIHKISKASSRSESEREIKRLESEMKSAAKQYDFERAAEIRDIIFEIKASLDK